MSMGESRPERRVRRVRARSVRWAVLVVLGVLSGLVLATGRHGAHGRNLLGSGVAAPAGSARIGDAAKGVHSRYYAGSSRGAVIGGGMAAAEGQSYLFGAGPGLGGIVAESGITVGAGRAWLAGRSGGQSFLYTGSARGGLTSVARLSHEGVAVAAGATAIWVAEAVPARKVGSPRRLLLVRYAYKAETVPRVLASSALSALSVTGVALAVLPGELDVIGASRQASASPGMLVRISRPGGSVLGSIPLPGLPDAALASGSAVFVSMATPPSSSATGTVLEGVEPAQGNVVSRVSVPDGYEPDVQAGSDIWGVTTANGQLVEVDPETGALVHQVLLSSNGLFVPAAALVGTGTRLYVVSSSIPSGTAGPAQPPSMFMVSAGHGHVKASLPIPIKSLAARPGCVALAPGAMWVEGSSEVLRLPFGGG
ncbi:MAG: hypothetical protein M0035_04470 [Actinomycetota bacterium]|nr:hypothetical protein [Actinomycetota bacterium]